MLNAIEPHLQEVELQIVHLKIERFLKIYAGCIFRLEIACISSWISLFITWETFDQVV